MAGPRVGRCGSNANLKGADLTDANLSGTNLTGANFEYATLTGTDFAGANLTMTNFKEATGLGTGSISGTTWSNTRCPDNTLSSNDGGSCSPNDLNPTT